MVTFLTQHPSVKPVLYGNGGDSGGSKTNSQITCEMEHYLTNSPDFFYINVRLKNVSIQYKTLTFFYSVPIVPLYFMDLLFQQPIASDQFSLMFTKLKLTHGDGQKKDVTLVNAF